MPITLIIIEHFFDGGNEMLENGFLLLREDSSLTSLYQCFIMSL